MPGRWDHNDRSYNRRNEGLWSAAPELRSVARRQANSLHRARSMFDIGDVEAWRIGHHAGRLLALRLEAYDRKHAGAT